MPQQISCKKQQNCAIKFNSSKKQKNPFSSIFLILIILDLINVLNAQYQQLGGKTILTNPCHSQTTCGTCITASDACVWCAAEYYNEPRCDFLNNLSRNGCNETTIQNPVNSVQTISDKELSSYPQLKPQKVTIRLRPHSTHTLKLQFKQALDYPIDLYYLMDLSKSMEDDRDNLVKLGNDISNQMQKITTNFRLGFGSFVEKVVMPYVNTVPEKLNAPCTDCAAPYGFIHHMALDTNANRFSERVNQSRISGNLDAPEGGFDAIMQAIVCGDHIGWRQHSRRLLLFSTDSSFHYAGDGKLGGIVKPNDGYCHLDKTGRYTESETLDYPSVSQINAKVKEHAVNLIFAVTEGQSDTYNELIKLVEGSTTGILKNDSSNIVELIKAEYQKITSTLELKHDMNSNLANYVKIKFYSKCLGNKTVETNSCSGLRVGTQVNFDIKFELLKCPENPSEWNQRIRIRPIGLQDELEIDLHMLCDCDCEKSIKTELTSPKCNYAGNYQCGICICGNESYGKNCECKKNELNPQLQEDKCKKHKNDEKMCSGRGQCRCGACECNQKFFDGEVIGNYVGKFCECDNWDCPRKNGLLCSGEDHGKCVCGRCDCDPKYEGDDCSCPSSNQTCIKEGEDEVCSGRGECVCGQCKCKSSDQFYYSGAWCEECPSCPTECQLYRDCVRCQVWNTGPLKDLKECNDTLAENAKCFFTTFVQDELEVNENIGEKLCEFIDDADDCRYKFKYLGTKDTGLIVTAKRHKECPKAVNILAIVLGVIVGIVLVGLALLLIWKLLTTIHDRREYAKFEKERQLAKWDTGENPIYKQAVTTFKNPIYGGKQ